MIRVAIVMITLVVIAFIIAWVVKKKNQPSAREIALGQAMRQIRDEALAYRETDSGLSYRITDIIRDDLEKKELL